MNALILIRLQLLKLLINSINATKAQLKLLASHNLLNSEVEFKLEEEKRVN